MKEIKYSPIQREPYNSDATLIWCIDCRFEDVLNQFIKTHNINNPDLIKFPGASKTLAKPYDSPEFQLFANNIFACGKLHSQEKVILTNHASCGAYSLDNNFQNDEEEKSKLLEDLKSAKSKLEKFLKEKSPDKEIKVETHFIDFDHAEQIS